VQGISASCSFQISYISLDTPLSNAKLSQPYELVLEQGEAKTFIYYHANSIPFKVVKMVGAGQLEAYILPMSTPELTLKDALHKNYKDYPIKDTDAREHIVDTADPSFCFDCFYIVVVTAPSTFTGEVIFLRSKDPIPLTANYMLKQWLLPKSEFKE
jgi:hypothetical protein